MKYMKERKFIKEVYDEKHIEIIVSRISILESSTNKDGDIDYVTFKDRFGEIYTIRRKTDGTKIVTKRIKAEGLSL